MLVWPQRQTRRYHGTAAPVWAERAAAPAAPAWNNSRLVVLLGGIGVDGVHVLAGAVAEFADVGTGEGGGDGPGNQQGEGLDRVEDQRECPGVVLFDLEKLEGEGDGEIQHADVARRVGHGGGEADNGQDARGNPEG